ncbi:MAG: glycosyltransferase [Bacteroidota bacterium]
MPLSDPDILFAITGDPRYNSRALKQLEVLTAAGYDVHVVGLAAAPASEMLYERIRLQLLERPSGGGPKFFWQTHQLFSAYVAGVKARAYHASDLYVLPALSGRVKKTGGKLVYDARERYPYVASTVGRPWARFFWEMLESRHIRRADSVFTVSQSIASHIAASYNIALPDVLYNVPAFKKAVPSEQLRETLDIAVSQTVILHQGKMQKSRGCLLLLQAMQHVAGATLVFLGDGPLRQPLEVAVAQYGLQDRVKFKAAVLPDELHAFTCSADIGVTLLEDTCLNHRYALPNKLFEYLMAGVPVLGSDLPEVGGVIEDYGVGRVVDASDPAQIGAVLQEMVDAPADRAKWAAASPAVFETFNWENASQVLRRNYKNLIPVPEQ